MYLFIIVDFLKLYWQKNRNAIALKEKIIENRRIFIEKFIFLMPSTFFSLIFFLNLMFLFFR